MYSYLNQIKTDPKSTAIKVPACAVLILNEQAQLLLIRPVGQAHWELPLDGIATDENVTEATLRLTDKITGLTLEEIECIGYACADSKNIIQLAEVDQSVHLHAFVMVSTAWSGDLKLSNTVEAAQFFSLSELPTTPEYVQHYIHKFKQWLPNRDFVFG